MRYRVFFKSNNRTLSISEARYQNILEQDPMEIKRFFEEDWPYIDALDIQYILPEDSINQEGSVVTPIDPDTIAQQKKLEHDRKISNPDAIISGIKERENDA